MSEPIRNKKLDLAGAPYVDFSSFRLLSDVLVESEFSRAWPDTSRSLQDTSEHAVEQCSHQFACAGAQRGEHQRR